MLNAYEVSIVFIDGSKHTSLEVAETVKEARTEAIKHFQYWHGECTIKLMLGTIARVISYDL